MLFPTFGFAVFFLVVFIGFWYVFRRPLDRKLFLIAASYLFYSFWDWRFCFALLFSTLANFGFARLIGSSREYVHRKLFLVLSILLNLLFLGFFKYYGFFADTANGLLYYIAAQGGQGTSPSFLFPLLSVVMPVGISFYTFKSMSYVFDVYLCKIPPAQDFLDLALYVSFFPQLASGPIVHAQDFLPRIGQALQAGIDPSERPIELDRALGLIVSGLMKKMVFANFLSTLFVNPLFSDLGSHNTLEVLLGAVGYSVVIYTDFSGYSDLAIGAALLLGFQTPVNFNRPYMSFSVTEFWKRWHITFSSWLREYLYFSMGGSRFGKGRTLVALVCTMILGGLWHGAAWNFLLWGAMQGIALAVERACNYGNRRSSVPWKGALQITGTFCFVTLSWIVFRASSLAEIGSFFAALGNVSKPLGAATPLVLILLVLGMAMHAVPGRVRKISWKLWMAAPLTVKAVLLALFFAFLWVVGMSGVAPFIYFQF